MRIVIASLFLLFAVAAQVSAEADPITVVSYNLKYASPIPPNAWPVRRPIMQRTLHAIDFDLMGTQEGLYPQIKHLDADLPDHDWIGLGREGGSNGEFMAIFYRRERFEPAGYDHFWLSDTPNVIGSSTWGNSNRRMVTWVLFEDRQTNRMFYFVNTHFDHRKARAREKSAELLLERTGRFEPNVPVIVTGDFNAKAEASKPYEILVGPGRFADTWSTAKKVGDQEQTWNGFRYPASKNGRRIDWILFRGPVTAETVRVDASHEGEQYPSDHFPVIATFRFR